MFFCMYLFCTFIVIFLLFSIKTFAGLSDGCFLHSVVWLVINAVLYDVYSLLWRKKWRWYLWGCRSGSMSVNVCVFEGVVWLCDCVIVETREDCVNWRKNGDVLTNSVTCLENKMCHALVRASADMVLHAG